MIRLCSVLISLTSLIACSTSATSSRASATPTESIATNAEQPTVELWSEHFDKAPLDWADPQDHSPEMLALVYGVEHEGPLSFLHAHHDPRVAGTPDPMHYGHALRTPPVPLENVRELRFRWRARTHPAVTNDAWQDLAAGVYVIVHIPTVFSGGRGFKFGWLAKPGASGTRQVGLLQMSLRTDPAGTEWKSESVDVCKLYRAAYGPCEGEKLLYVGVTTDGDGTKTLAEGDYADFELLGVK